MPSHFGSMVRAHEDLGRDSLESRRILLAKSVRALSVVVFNDRWGTRWGISDIRRASIFTQQRRSALENEGERNACMSQYIRFGSKNRQHSVRGPGWEFVHLRRHLAVLGGRRLGNLLRSSVPDLIESLPRLGSSARRHWI